MRLITHGCCLAKCCGTFAHGQDQRVLPQTFIIILGFDDFGFSLCISKSLLPAPASTDDSTDSTREENNNQDQNDLEEQCQSHIFFLSFSWEMNKDFSGDH